MGRIVTRDLTDPSVEFSTLVEMLRWRALQQPEQRTHTFLFDGEAEGDHLTHAALDCQARSIGAMLQSYRAGGERALLLYPAGLEFIAAFFGCLYARVIAVPLPPPNLAQPQRTLPRLRAIIGDAQPSVVLTTSAILSNTESLFTQAPELQKMRWLATDTGYRQPGAGMARPGRDRPHLGIAPVHFRLHRGTEGCHDQSREPPPQLGLY